MGLGLVDGAGEARHVQHTSDDNDEDKAGAGQQDITFLHGSSFEVVRISLSEPEVLLEQSRFVNRVTARERKHGHNIFSGSDEMLPGISSMKSPCDSASVSVTVVPSSGTLERFSVPS